MLRVDIQDNLAAVASKLGQLTDRQVRYVVARAMTDAAKAAQQELKQVTPRYIDRPVPFTLNSTYVRFASPSKLVVEVGFKEFASKGTPAGKYLQPMISGGGRRLKSTERQLQSRGLLPTGSYIIPTGVYPLRLNQYGNLSGGTYTQVLSRLRGFGEQGYTANVSGSARSQAKRRERDYFIGRPGGLPLGIYARVGRRPRSGGLPQGFHTVFYVTRQPRYSPTFPVPHILESTFTRSFSVLLQSGLQAELARHFS